MSKLLVALVALTAVASTAYFFVQKASLAQNIPTPVYDLWEHWRQKYSKTYGGEAETAYRLSVFNENYNVIKQHQLDESRTFDMDFNQFMDLTASEFSAYYKGLKKGSQKNVVLLEESSIPDSVDWRNTAVTPIKDQGQCGSCWAFSTVGALEGVSALFGDKTLRSFSESQLVDCSSSYGNYGCNGGWMDNGFKFVVDHGIELESEYPYQPVTRACAAQSGNFKISGYVDIAVGNVDQLATAAAQQPVSIALDATNFQFYSSGVFNNCGTQLDHGVTLVGYTPEYWLVKNSWGNSWGEQGYIRLARGNTCGLANAASYPTL